MPYGWFLMGYFARLVAYGLGACNVWVVLLGLDAVFRLLFVLLGVGGARLGALCRYVDFALLFTCVVESLCIWDLFYCHSGWVYLGVFVWCVSAFCVWGFRFWDLWFLTLF